MIRRLFATAANIASTAATPATTTATGAAVAAVAGKSPARVSMARNVNSVTLIGHVGANPELRQLNDTTHKVTFPLATTLGGKTQWHRVAFYNNPDMVKYADEHVTVGALVLVRGHLSYQRYESNGVQKISCEIVASQQLSVVARAQRDGPVPALESVREAGQGEHQQ